MFSWCQFFCAISYEIPRWREDIDKMQIIPDEGRKHSLGWGSVIEVFKMPNIFLSFIFIVIDTFLKGLPGDSHVYPEQHASGL